MRASAGALGSSQRPACRARSSAAIARTGTSAASGQQLEVLAERGVEHQRLPQGEWIGLDALTRMHAGGPALAEGILHDERGPLGRAFQTLVVQAR
jgi:hypothetical protein